MFGRSFREPHPLTSLSGESYSSASVFAVLLGLFLHSAYNMEGGIFPGLIAVFGGAGLILFYFIANRKVRTDRPTDSIRPTSEACQPGRPASFSAGTPVTIFEEGDVYRQLVAKILAVELAR